ncbi:MAG: D-alanyl-D-alanine carboxypeptidase/D-alanyl-D-alanine-endopeptidase [Betaproteobacteria bacterium]|nr:D-alanyl-D-alanine carboxypeptidase/D-alanyl-D-alanine-endopeptidase [Betaproteobacteria bacterium]
MLLLRLRRLCWLGLGAALPALSHAAPPADLPRPVLQALAQAQVPPQAAAFWVADLPSGQIRISHRAGEAMNPASAIKLLTTSAALELLGPQHTWRTTVLAEGSVQGQLLKGHLVLRGGGDPKLVIERLQSMLAQVQANGIKAIEGDIVLDRSLWRVPAVHPGQFDGEPLKPYNAQPDALLVNFKSMVLTFTPEPAQRRARVTLEPPLAGVQIDASVPLAGGAPCDDWRSGLQAVIDQPHRVQFRGRYPASCGERIWPTAYPEPESFAARAIEGLWRQLGGGLSGRVRDATEAESAALARSGTLSGARPVLRLDAPSLPLAEIVQDINKFSNNVMAQQVFYTLGLRAEPAAAGTLAGARAVVLDWWRQRLPGSTPPVLDNGSGLSRSERVSAQALSDLLGRMARSPVADDLLASLPVAGMDATMRNRARAVAGQAWLKTGSLRDVSAIAGYAQSASGRRYAVVGIINHDNAGPARAALDALVQWVVQQDLP